jgi:hypothetical protein
MKISELTGGWICLPENHDKSVVLGGGKVLYPCNLTDAQFQVLKDHIVETARRAFQAGRRAGKEEIRKAIFE